MSRPVVVLSSVQLEDLRPTQMALGMREVAEKRRQWRKHADKDQADYFSRHVFPTVLGPKKRHYLIDHHHLARAMIEEKVNKVMVDVTLDLSELGAYSFWVFLDDPAGAIPMTERSPEGFCRHSQVVGQAGRRSLPLLSR